MRNGRPVAMDTLQLRPATLGDMPALLALESLFPSDRMSARSFRRFIASARARVLVATQHADVLGNLVLLVRANSRKARIYSVVVSPQARGMGIGARLVDAAEKWARAQSLSEMTLEVRADNRAARSLYAGRGYVVERELPKFYDDGADGLRLRLPLDKSGSE